MAEKYDELMKLANQVSRSTVAVVDAVTQRGGFKGEELSTIGQLRDQAIQVISVVENLQQDAYGDRRIRFTFKLKCDIMFFVMEYMNGSILMGRKVSPSNNIRLYSL